MSSKDKTIEAQNIEISSLKDEINRLKAEKEELQATIKAARQKGSKEAEKAVDAALVRIGRVLGISDYCGGLDKMVDFVKDLVTRDKNWMHENVELKKEIKELKRSMEPEQSIGLHR
jgi:predicted RNase H-like nuclease (RuvC/YqgF family)